MRKFILRIVTATVVMLPAVEASASLFTFTPPDADLYDLDHYKAYKWRINWSLPPGEYIKSAKLTYCNIYNWTAENTDRLYTQLLNSTHASPRLSVYTDNQFSTNYFGGSGVNVGTWTDPDDNLTRENLVYNFDLSLRNTLTAYAADGFFAFGIDPDCHYFNDRVKFEICTATAVPEPATMGLFGIGLAGMGYLKRRKKNS